MMFFSTTSYINTGPGRSSQCYVTLLANLSASNCWTHVVLRLVRQMYLDAPDWNESLAASYQPTSKKEPAIYALEDAGFAWTSRSITATAQSCDNGGIRYGIPTLPVRQIEIVYHVASLYADGRVSAACNLAGLSQSCILSRNEAISAIWFRPVRT